MARKYYRRYKKYKRYGKARRYKALTLRSTKTFTVTIRMQVNVGFIFGENSTISSITTFAYRYLAGYTDNTSIETNTYFGKFKQIFGEYKINSMRVTIIPTNGDAEPKTIYILTDRKFTNGSEIPSASTIVNSMTANAYPYTSAGSMKARKLVYATNINEKSTYIDSGSTSTALNSQNAFMPAFYVCVSKTSATSAATTLNATAQFAASITFRNPCY